MYGLRMDDPFPVSGPLLFCVAAPAECDRVLAAFDAKGPTQPGSNIVLAHSRPGSGGGGVELLATGVGPTSAGVSAAAALARRPASAVISLGIAGAYPDSGVGLLETVLSTRSILAGEGRSEPDAFAGLAAMGFGPFEGADWADTSPELVGRLSAQSRHRGPIATVSAVSGTDALALLLQSRTGAVAEAMEGAAVHLACRRAGVPFAEIRVVSNMVGDRDRHPWKLAEALDRLGPLAIALARAIRG